MQCLLRAQRRAAIREPKEAVEWLNGKTVAAPKGSCTDRFARAVFKKENVNPGSYLNQNIELITSGFRAKKLDGAVVWEPIASRLVAEGLARRVATGNDFGENDGAFIDMRADLIQQRPDVVKAWLETELDAELYLADPKKADQVVKLLKAQTTGFDEELLAGAVRHLPRESRRRRFASRCPSASPRGPGADQAGHGVLYEVKSIAIPQLAPDAVVAEATEEILKERGLKAPVAEIKAATRSGQVTQRHDEPTTESRADAPIHRVSRKRDRLGAAWLRLFRSPKPYLMVLGYGLFLGLVPGGRSPARWRASPRCPGSARSRANG